jgi:hypothetical protein
MCFALLNQLNSDTKGSLAVLFLKQTLSLSLLKIKQKEKCTIHSKEYEMNTYCQKINTKSTFAKEK